MIARLLPCLALLPLLILLAPRDSAAADPTLAKLCDELILVTTNELPAVHATQNTLAYLEHRGVSRSKIKLVVNRYEKRNSLHVKLDQLQATLGAPPFWGFPNRYEEAMKSIHEARPVVMRGNTDLGKSYRDFAKKVTSAVRPAAAAAENR